VKRVGGRIYQGNIIKQLPYKALRRFPTFCKRSIALIKRSFISSDKQLAHLALAKIKT
jgi:phage terminase Nu1 subunit (DNA packaging protein)